MPDIDAGDRGGCIGSQASSVDAAFEALPTTFRRIELVAPGEDKLSATFEVRECLMVDRHC